MFDGDKAKPKYFPSEFIARNSDFISKALCDIVFLGIFAA